MNQFQDQSKFLPETACSNGTGIGLELARMADVKGQAKFVRSDSTDLIHARGLVDSRIIVQKHIVTGL